MDRQDKQTGIQTDGQTDEQRDRQNNRITERKRETDRQHTKTYFLMLKFAYSVLSISFSLENWHRSMRDLGLPILDSHCFLRAKGIN